MNKEVFNTKKYSDKCLFKINSCKDYWCSTCFYNANRYEKKEVNTPKYWYGVDRCTDPNCAKCNPKNEKTVSDSKDTTIIVIVIKE